MACPLSYIFGIIHHIKKRIINSDNIYNNYINNNNNYNSDVQNVIIKAVGPCVRNLLRNEPIAEIYMVISSYRIKDEFISLLTVMELMDWHEQNGNVVNLRFYYKNRLYKMQIAESIMQLTHYAVCCAFTCDNLVIDSEGNISTVYNHNQVNNFTNVKWINSCINDILNSKFRIMLYETMNTLEMIYSYNEMFNQLIRNGLEYDRCNTKNLTHFNFVEMKRHTDIKTFSCQRDVSVSCGICQEKYEDEPQKGTILVGCLHDFHVDCLQKWISKSIQQNCPICRSNLRFQLIKGYGDEQVDRIIENMQE